MRSKSRTHVTMHIRGPHNEPTPMMVRINDIELARPVGKQDAYHTPLPPEYVTIVMLKDFSQRQEITETVAELQARLNEDPVADQLKEIKKTLLQILGHLKTS